MAKIQGEWQFYQRLNRLAGGVDITSSLVREATFYKDEYVRILRLNTDGPETVRYNPRRVVNVSPPGSPPNSDLTTLEKSAEVVVNGKNSVEVTVGAEYAEYLEFGTPIMAPRPLLRPLAKKWFPSMSKRIRADLLKEILK